MAIMQIVVMPRAVEGATGSTYVAELHKYLKTQKLPYKLHDMGTLVQGRSSELWALARKLHDLPFAKGVRRVYTIVNIDDRRDRIVSLGDKVKSVQKKLRQK